MGFTPDGWIDPADNDHISSRPGPHPEIFRIYDNLRKIYPNLFGPGYRFICRATGYELDYVPRKTLKAKETEQTTGETGYVKIKRKFCGKLKCLGEAYNCKIPPHQVKCKGCGGKLTTSEEILRESQVEAALKGAVGK